MIEKCALKYRATNRMVAAHAAAIVADTAEIETEEVVADIVVAEREDTAMADAKNPVRFANAMAKNVEEATN